MYPEVKGQKLKLMFFKVYSKDLKAYGSAPRKIIKLEDEREEGKKKKKKGRKERRGKYANFITALSRDSRNTL